jgi:LacI family transcriptional regulator
MKRPKSPVTIKDVAAAASVSVSTVSRVLNGKDDVADETQAKVRRVIQDLSYTSSLAARSMRSRRTNVIGVVVPDLQTSFSIQVVKGVNRAIEDFAYDLIVYTSGAAWDGTRAARERHHVALLNGSLADGAIIVTPTTSDFSTAHPVVIVDPQQASPGVPAVISTNRLGAREAVNYLVGLGHRRIGFISGRADLQSAHRRFQGYQESLAEAGIPFDPGLVRPGDFLKPLSFASARELFGLPDPPTAIFAANDISAIAAVEAAQAAGLRVPGDLSVIGFDNIPEAAQAAPRLTTIDQSLELMGYTAVEMLIELLQGKPLDSNLRKVPTRLVVRESCRALP